jgi:hypothetical protein
MRGNTDGTELTGKASTTDGFHEIAMNNQAGWKRVRLDRPDFADEGMDVCAGRIVHAIIHM